MQVPIITKAPDGVLELSSARWGLIPHWWKKDKPPSLTFNARSEEAADRPTWRDSLRSQRCLIPASGWYEWNEQEQTRNEAGRIVNQPYLFYAPDSDLIAFAGLWAVWNRPDANPVVSCALLSKGAAPSIAAIHHRMPVVLKPEQYDACLSSKTTTTEVWEIIANPVVDFEAYRVSTRVNSARNDGPELLEHLRAVG